MDVKYYLGLEDMKNIDKPIILIKIGGSLITDKTIPFSLKEKALDVICKEIKLASQGDKQLIVGHGAGSFAHVPAKKYQTHKGIINDLSYRGIAEVADTAAQLNRIVMAKLLEKQINAVTINPLSIITTTNHQLKSLCLDSLEQLLRLNLVPVLYGDQILDTEIGCTVYSTEKILGYLAIALKNKGYQIERIIHCGQTNGVYDADSKTIPLINTKNFGEIKNHLSGSGGIDVTGGMLHKVEETLALAQKGIPGLIIDGIENGSLSRAVNGEEVFGTRVEA